MSWKQVDLGGQNSANDSLPNQVIQKNSRNSGLPNSNFNMKKASGKLYQYFMGGQPQNASNTMNYNTS